MSGQLFAGRREREEVREVEKKLQILDVHLHLESVADWHWLP